jgi:hypothetical protein
MVAAVEHRFGRVNRLPVTIEWLSDNGCCYIAGDTRSFARDIGLEPRTTPIENPQSNGMAEAFVRTIKRDYVRVNPCPDAQTVMRQLPAWITHYTRFTRIRPSDIVRPASHRSSRTSLTVSGRSGATAVPHTEADAVTHTENRAVCCSVHYTTVPTLRAPLGGRNEVSARSRRSVEVKFRSSNCRHFSPDPIGSVKCRHDLLPPCVRINPIDLAQLFNLFHADTSADTSI